MEQYKKLTTICKALSDPARVQILDMLSCGEMCACELLQRLQISQSTLSHHMKVLINSKLVIGKKKATWMNYSLNSERISSFHELLIAITEPKDECICNISSKSVSDEPIKWNDFDNK